MARGETLLLPLVCGWIWRYPSQVDLTLALLKKWSFKWKDTIHHLPPLVKHLLGFTSTNLVTWTVASNISGLLQALFIYDGWFLGEVKSHLLCNSTFVQRTGVVIGYATETQVCLQLASLHDPQRNFFGRPPPERCGECGGPLRLRYALPHHDNKNTLPPRVFANCLLCKAGTPPYTYPFDTILPGICPDVFFWNLPLPPIQWQWAKVPSKTLVELQNMWS